MSEREASGRAAHLIIKNGGFEGMTYEITAEETLIGRNPTTDITLLDEGISREHAIILYDEDDDGLLGGGPPVHQRNQGEREADPLGRPRGRGRGPGRAHALRVSPRGGNPGRPRLIQSEHGRRRPRSGNR